ncbi:DUF2092 domain-containing protein [Parasedimentitalea marina]|uniref:DUF2092 domain-containing protein n=1 Tax=Parasedimentitalea marina TaxID=2483033 RepID=A0A3T0N207_9RHOB|nr:DUF2092 domain-containing protein [Parasedimentitalea marina]AZV78056.1 DUF2092 domain-containing protein [Parasedimentitalea marina]
MTVFCKHYVSLCCAAALTAVAGAFPAMGQTEAAPPPTEPPTVSLDPQAIDILTSASQYLAGQDVLSMDWFVSFDVVVDGREKITYMRNGANLLQRGVGFYGYSEFGGETREFFFDGTKFQIFDVEENAYVSAAITSDFDTLADRIGETYDIRLPIWQVMSASPRGELLDRATAAAYLGTTRIAGREAHHLAFSNYETDWQIWISTDVDQPELMMIVGTDPYTQGWPQYRAYFTNWNFAPDVPEGVFTFVPDEDADLMAWPKPEDVSILGGRN